MRLLSLDYDPVFDDATRGTFRGDVSVFDYDAVIWDPQETFWHYTTYAEDYQGLPSLTENSSVQIKSDTSRRRREFLEFLEAGRSLAVLARPPLRCYVDTGTRTHSGTGRNRVTTTHVAEFDLWSALPTDDLKLERASGSRIEIVGDGPIASLLKRYKHSLTYNAVLEKAPGLPVARVTGTPRIVGSIFASKGGGNLILLPTVNFSPVAAEDGEEDWPEEAAQFQGDLVAALLEPSAGAISSRPSWADNYATKAQQELKDKVVAQQQKVEKARVRLAKLQGQREEAEARDQLYLGTGRALELQVREVLGLLGGEVRESEAGRDDWHVAFPEGPAVLEVKGLTKSAAEKHAAQLEKWVAGAYEESGTMPKGILVANTWREEPLSERDKEDFPTQMVPYSEGRGHCLLTGLQLFLIQADVEADPDRAEYWRKTLLKTRGVLKDPTDWRSVVQVTETEEAEE